MWNEYAVKHCKANGAASDPALKYVASKVVGERAAWEFAESNTTKVHFDLVTILPPYVSICVSIIPTAVLITMF